MGALSQPGSAKEHKNSRSVTPTLNSFPSAADAFTPDRGSFLRTLDLPSQANYTPPTKTEALTPTFARNGLSFPTSASGGDSGRGGGGATAAEAAEGLRAMYNSPPTLAQGMYSDGIMGMGGGGMLGLTGHLFTPLVPRRQPALTVHSTCKAPSFYAKDLFSSPAPFWKYMNMATPAQLPEPSPTKDGADEDEDEDDYEEDDDEEDRTRGVPVSSSPNKAGEDEEAGEDDDEEDDGTGEVEGRGGRETLPVQPSSPPVLPPPSSPTEVVSPSRTVSRPTSRHLDFVSSSLAQSSNEVAAAAPAAPALMLQPAAKLDSSSPVRASTNAYAPLPAMMGLTAAAAVVAEGLGPREAYARVIAMDEADDEGVEIDLAR
jgi:hypothetical protein